MTKHRPSAKERADAQAMAAELARCSGAAWVIDPFAARVLAANAAGQIHFGLPWPFDRFAFDPAMPSLQRLKVLAAPENNAATLRETMLFWTPAGKMSLLCDVSRVPSNAGAPALLIHA